MWNTTTTYKTWLNLENGEKLNLDFIESFSIVDRMEKCTVEAVAISGLKYPIKKCENYEEAVKFLDDLFNTINQNIQGVMKKQ